MWIYVNACVSEAFWYLIHYNRDQANKKINYISASQPSMTFIKKSLTGDMSRINLIILGGFLLELSDSQDFQKT